MAGHRAYDGCDSRCRWLIDSAMRASHARKDCRCRRWNYTLEWILPYVRKA